MQVASEYGKTHNFLSHSEWMVTVLPFFTWWKWERVVMLTMRRECDPSSLPPSKTYVIAGYGFNRAFQGRRRVWHRGCSKAMHRSCWRVPAEPATFGIP